MKEKNSVDKISKDLINNLLNPYNGDYLLATFYFLEEEEDKTIIIDLLKERIEPRDASNETLEKVINYSKKCFLTAYKIIETDNESLKKVEVLIRFQKKFEKGFQIEVRIITSKKSYVKKAKIKTEKTIYK
ncbi:MAG: hypothetical protein WC867_08290 [Candidatus Pacearchaeota archaeon]|jgi:hypothetical protein